MGVPTSADRVLGGRAVVVVVARGGFKKEEGVDFIWFLMDGGTRRCVGSQLELGGRQSKAACLGFVLVFVLVFWLVTMYPLIFPDVGCEKESARERNEGREECVASKLHSCSIQPRVS